MSCTKELSAAQARLRGRLQRISELQPGWLDGSGKPPDQGVLGSARALVNELLSQNILMAVIFPHPGGSVEIASSSPKLDWQLDVLTSRRIVALQQDRALEFPWGSERQAVQWIVEQCEAQSQDC